MNVENVDNCTQSTSHALYNLFTLFNSMRQAHFGSNDEDKHFNSIRTIFLELSSKVTLSRDFPYTTNSSAMYTWVRMAGRSSTGRDAMNSFSWVGSVCNEGQSFISAGSRFFREFSIVLLAVYLKHKTVLIWFPTETDRLERVTASGYSSVTSSMALRYVLRSIVFPRRLTSHFLSVLDRSNFSMLALSPVLKHAINMRGNCNKDSHLSYEEKELRWPGWGNGSIWLILLTLGAETFSWFPQDLMTVSFFELQSFLESSGSSK